ncbi:MAG TPA: HypC/HybG/HupF family hydrogenase formation chaperone [bacterium]
MCLAIPMRVVEVRGDEGTVELGGVRHTVGLQLLEGVRPGEYVIVHAGFAIQRLDEKDAEKTLALIRSMETMR